MSGSYWRAPSWVRPVAASAGLPRKPLSSGQAPEAVPRGAPNGVDQRLAKASVSALIASPEVPWWSPARKVSFVPETPAVEVRTAMTAEPAL